ncbi:MAG: PilZ domain-containing protein [Spirochaetaceae bacterium]|nr:PilZ domain-containing protein [Spirochaetaceae bacterium]
MYDEEVPIMYLKNRNEYILFLEKPTKDHQMYFKSDRPVPGLRPKKKLDLMFDYRGKVIFFSVDVISTRDDHIVADVPEMLYKNLDRSYSRVSTPDDLQIQFAFLGDRYSLTFPKITEYEPPEDIGELMQRLDPKNLTGLIAQMAAWIKGFANGYRLVIFKDVKPESTEERILAETGKALFLPSTLLPLPKTDPYPRKRLILEETFHRYLESTGVAPTHIDDEMARFIKSKFDSGIFSDAWVPILFQEYVIGYIHVWINKTDKSPFNYEMIETLYQFSKVLAFSLKENGYFDSGRLKNEPFQGKVVDISASGLLFAYPHSPLSTALLPESELSVRLIAPHRTINTNAEIVRRYKDATMGYFGCRFLDMVPEDMRFLFELIYGKPFTDFDASFLAGQV